MKRSSSALMMTAERFCIRRDEGQLANYFGKNPDHRTPDPGVLP